jgi:hypothetical protein
LTHAQTFFRGVMANSTAEKRLRMRVYERIGGNLNAKL